MSPRFFKKIEPKDVIPFIQLLRLPTLYLLSILKNYQEEQLSKHLKDLPSSIKNIKDESSTNCSPRS